MMKKQPTATQQALIDNGAATRTLTIRYESSHYGDKARRETVKATLPDLGDGHATFRAGRDTYIIANNAIYRAQTHNIDEAHWDRQPGELHETFYMGTYDDKAETVSEAYDNAYSNSVVVNGYVARIIDNALYAHLLDGRMYVVDDLDTDLGDYSGSEYVRVTSQKIGSWRVPLIHAAKLRDAYRQHMNNYGVDGDLYDETASIPFNDAAVEAALTANAEGARWGVDTGVYVPTTEEMDAADALGGAFSGVERGYGKANSIATARRIADALAAYEDTRKGATVL